MFPNQSIFQFTMKYQRKNRNFGSFISIFFGNPIIKSISNFYFKKTSVYRRKMSKKTGRLLSGEKCGT